MKYNRLIITFFSLMVIAQLYVPASMIIGAERTVSHGKTFFFETAPLDPTDPFRGKYVQLRFTEERQKADKSAGYKKGQTLYALIEEDNRGSASIASLQPTEPENHADYIEVKVAWKTKKKLRLTFPFSRFYMEESKALPAEKLYREASSDSSIKAFARVHIKEGKAVLTDVLIGERSLVELAAEYEEDKD